MIFTAISVATIDHQMPGEAGLFDERAGVSDMLTRIVCAALSTAEDHMAIGVSRRGHDRREALFRHAEEAVRMDRCADGVDRDLHRAARTVFKADGHAEPRGELAVDLALRGSRPDGAPAHKVRDELRRDRIEEFGPRRHLQRDDITKELARAMEALVDLEAAVEVRIVDEPLPADRRTRLLEIGAHDDHQIVRIALGLTLEPLGIIERGDRIVNGARADDDEQTIVFTLQDP